MFKPFSIFIMNKLFGLVSMPRNQTEPGSFVLKGVRCMVIPLHNCFVINPTLIFVFKCIVPNKEVYFLLVIIYLFAASSLSLFIIVFPLYKGGTPNNYKQSHLNYHLGRSRELHLKEGRLMALIATIISPIIYQLLKESIQIENCI